MFSSVYGLGIYFINYKEQIKLFKLTVGKYNAYLFTKFPTFKLIIYVPTYVICIVKLGKRTFTSYMCDVEMQKIKKRNALSLLAQKLFRQKRFTYFILFLVFYKFNNHFNVL